MKCLFVKQRKRIGNVRKGIKSHKTEISLGFRDLKGLRLGLKDVEARCTSGNVSLHLTSCIIHFTRWTLFSFIGFGSFIILLLIMKGWIFTKKSQIHQKLILQNRSNFQLGKYGGSKKLKRIKQFSVNGLKLQNVTNSEWGTSFDCKSNVMKANLKRLKGDWRNPDDGKDKRIALVWRVPSIYVMRPTWQDTHKPHAPMPKWHCLLTGRKLRIKPIGYFSQCFYPPFNKSCIEEHRESLLMEGQF